MRFLYETYCQQRINEGFQPLGYFQWLEAYALERSKAYRLAYDRLAPVLKTPMPEESRHVIQLLLKQLQIAATFTETSPDVLNLRWRITSAENYGVVMVKLLYQEQPVFALVNPTDDQLKAFTQLVDLLNQVTR